MLTNEEPDGNSFREDVLRGLLKDQKELPCKYLYDEKGSRLFESICQLDEYYIPRVERGILEANIGEIVDVLGPGVLLVEYGCGDCVKTRFLLENMHRPVTFAPIDISGEQLGRVAGELASEFPWLELLPVCADFTGDFELPKPEQPTHKVVVYFPGSTIGNFDPAESVRLLKNIAGVCGPGGALLIGIDLAKDPDVLHHAYNDPVRMTAAFNLNLLERINRQLGGNFRLDRFDHKAIYDRTRNRVEMHLVSLADQIVRLDGVTIPFSKGESIWTESSYKYDPDEFNRLAASAGFEMVKAWTDERKWFSVQHLVIPDG